MTDFLSSWWKGFRFARLFTRLEDLSNLDICPCPIWKNAAPIGAMPPESPTLCWWKDAFRKLLSLESRLPEILTFVEPPNLVRMRTELASSDANNHLVWVPCPPIYLRPLEIAEKHEKRKKYKKQKIKNLACCGLIQIGHLDRFELAVSNISILVAKQMIFKAHIAASRTIWLSLWISRAPGSRISLDQEYGHVLLYLFPPPDVLMETEWPNFREIWVVQIKDYL